MDFKEAESNERESAAAVDLLDRLLDVSDGGRRVVLGQFEASTLLAMLTDELYRVKIMSQLEDFGDIATLK